MKPFSPALRPYLHPRPETISPETVFVFYIRLMWQAHSTYMPPLTTSLPCVPLNRIFMAPDQLPRSPLQKLSRVLPAQCLSGELGTLNGGE